MLDQQFTVNPDYYNFTNKNFIALQILTTNKKNSELIEKFSKPSTPTVIIMENNGTEIDRIVTYSNPPEKFLTNLRNAFNRVDTFEELLKKYNSNKYDFEAAIKLARKYEKSDNKYYLAKEIYAGILEDKDLAKKTIVEHPDIDGEATAYEWAMYRLGKADYDMKIWKDLLDEYPNTIFAQAMFATLFRSGFIRRFEEEDRKEFFENALEHHPDYPDLLRGFVSFANETGWNLIEASAAADKLDDDFGIFVANFKQIYKNHAEILKKLGDDEGPSRVYGPHFMDKELRFFSNTLSNYVGYWMKAGGNDESVNETIDILLKLDKDGSIRNMLANSLARNKRTDKALEIYGPEFIRNIKNDARLLNTYASTWSRYGENLESALEASLRAEEMEENSVMPDLPAKIMLQLGRESDALNNYGEEYLEKKADRILELNAFISFWEKQEKHLGLALKGAKKLAATRGISFDWQRVSKVYELMGDLDSAIKSQQKAVDVAPDPQKERFETRLIDLKMKRR